jgi:hypothetical protein
MSPVEGELYLHGVEEKKISATVRRKYFDPTKDELLKFYTFDFYEPRVKYKHRASLLASYFGRLKEHGTQYIDYVATKPMQAEKNMAPFSLHRILKNALQKGYEGLVLKNPESYYYNGDCRRMEQVKIKK